MELLGGAVLGGLVGAAIGFAVFKIILALGLLD
ncbi:hypothetical protein LCGC14_2265180 [marine sediment metagenome]|uniref:Uncharacterized protein n=1 Tax=marine sediment metagenome TaxID=412755 RepID=A0A0F9DKS2_9ZZZZ